jgi:hypothetical protein
MKKVLLLSGLLILGLILFGCTQTNTPNPEKAPVLLNYTSNQFYCGDESLAVMLPTDDDLLKETDFNKGTDLTCARLSEYFTSQVPYLTGFIYKTYLYDSKAVYVVYILSDESSELADWHILKIYSDFNTLGRSADISFVNNNKVFVATNKNGFDWAGWKSGNKVIMIEGHGVKELYPRIVESILAKLPSDTQ